LVRELLEVEPDEPSMPLLRDPWRISAKCLKDSVRKVLTNPVKRKSRVRRKLPKKRKIGKPSHRGMIIKRNGLVTIVSVTIKIKNNKLPQILWKSS
jgi:hypothetical protein